MRSIRINAKDRTITEDSFEKETCGALDYLQGCVGGLIELIRIDDGVDLYVDEEGLLKSNEYFFTFKGYHQPLAGDGVIVGSDGGETSDLPKRITVNWVKSRVGFITRSELLKQYRKSRK